MATVTPPRATVTVSSTYEVGGPSTAAVEGPSAPFPALGLFVPPTVIEDLSTRLGNLEYRHGVLMRKVEEVSDAEVADSIAIGEIHPRVATVEEQIQVMESKAVQVLRTRVAEMESHMGILMSYMLWMEERLTILEKRLLGPPPGPSHLKDKSSPLKRSVIEINVLVKLSEGENIFTLLRIPMHVSLLLLTAWRESHASHYDRVVPKRKYLRYCLKRVSVEMSDMCDTFGVSTAGREEDFFSEIKCSGSVVAKDWKFEPNGDICLHHGKTNQVNCSHWKYKFPPPVKVVATARRLEMPLPEVCTAIEEKKMKLPVKDRWQLH
nr:hypothetical protein [Tanacetum cinerariifolium]